MSFKELIRDFEENLIDKKQQLNEEIEDILYNNINEDLNFKEINEIQEKRKRIKAIYDTIEYLDECILVFLEK